MIMKSVSASTYRVSFQRRCQSKGETENNWIPVNVAFRALFTLLVTCDIGSGGALISSNLARGLVTSGFWRDKMALVLSVIARLLVMRGVWRGLSLYQLIMRCAIKITAIGRVACICWYFCFSRSAHNWRDARKRWLLKRVYLMTTDFCVVNVI